MLRRLVPLLILPLLAADDKKFELTEVDKAIFELTNKEREKEKLSGLTVSPLLCEVARKHSANMAKQGEMKHELNGKNPADRVKAAGYEYKFMAENIAASDGDKPEGIVKAWMDSEHHRENILNGKFTEIGLGSASNDKETYYTQVFATPKRKR